MEEETQQPQEEGMGLAAMLAMYAAMRAARRVPDATELTPVKLREMRDAKCYRRVKKTLLRALPCSKAGFEIDWPEDVRESVFGRLRDEGFVVEPAEALEEGRARVVVSWAWLAPLAVTAARSDARGDVARLTPERLAQMRVNENYRRVKERLARVLPVNGATVYIDWTTGVAEAVCARLCEEGFTARIEPVAPEENGCDRRLVVEWK